MTFQQAHPADGAIERFGEAEHRWRSVSRTTVQDHVRNGFTDVDQRALERYAAALTGLFVEPGPSAP